MRPPFPLLGICLTIPLTCFALVTAAQSSEPVQINWKFTKGSNIQYQATGSMLNDMQLLNQTKDSVIESQPNKFALLVYGGVLAESRRKVNVHVDSIFINQSDNLQDATWSEMPSSHLQNIEFTTRKGVKAPEYKILEATLFPVTDKILHEQDTFSTTFTQAFQFFVKSQEMVVTATLTCDSIRMVNGLQLAYISSQIKGTTSVEIDNMQTPATGIYTGNGFYVFNATTGKYIQANVHLYTQLDMEQPALDRLFSESESQSQQENLNPSNTKFMRMVSQMEIEVIAIN